MFQLFMKKDLNNKEARSLEETNQFNDALTDEIFICCSIKGKQMIYIELACQSGGHRVVGKLSRRLRACLPVNGATIFKSF